MKPLPAPAFSLLLLAVGAFAYAPFCLHYNSGLVNCFYYSADDCKRAAYAAKGVCAPRAQAAQAAPPSALQAPAPVRPNAAAEAAFEGGRLVEKIAESAEREKAAVDAEAESKVLHYYLSKKDPDYAEAYARAMREREEKRAEIKAQADQQMIIVLWVTVAAVFIALIAF